MTRDIPVWQAVRALKPARSPESHFAERLVRGEPWLFVHNELTGQHVRVSELARQVVLRLDGDRSVETLVDTLSSDAGNAEKEALAANLLTLSQLGMVELGSELADHLIQQRAGQLSNHRKAPWHNPLAIRIPLMNPDRWLTRVNDRCGYLMNHWLLVVMLVVIALGGVAAMLNATDIGKQLGVLARTPQQWWQFIVVYPILKWLHEFSHAIVIKRLKGSVHEAGLTILVLMPVPYVDATDIWRFESRRQRVLVSAAGMLTEIMLASLGLMLWLTVEPGLLSDLAFAVALTGSVTTLLFNANPLLKFDGYQILQDALDIPNLATRSTRYISYLCKRYLLGVIDARTPVTGQGERSWLFAYALASVSYRWFITLGIALYLVTRFPVLGGLLAIFALYKLAVTPFLSAIVYLTSSPELRQTRVRAGCVSGSVLASCIGLVFLLPVPTHTRAQGVVDVPHQAQLFAPQTGEVAQIYVAQGDTVAAGQPILRIAAPDLSTRVAVVQSQLDVLELDYQAALINEPALVTILSQEIAEKSEALKQATVARHSLVVHAQVAGRVSLLEPFSRIGEYVNEGVAMGHIVSDQQLLVKAVVQESGIARVEKGVHTVSVRLAERFWEPLSAQLTYVSPAANNQLPSQALAATISHGGIAVASSVQGEWKTIEPVFQLEFQLPVQTRAVGIGGRAYVTLAHHSEPIGTRTWRALRRLVLQELAF